MHVRRLLPEGGVQGIGANLAEALNYRGNPNLYQRRRLEPSDVASLRRQLHNLRPGSFAQGSFDNCYLIANLVAFVGTELGRQQIRHMVSINESFVTVSFWDGSAQVGIPVRSVFTSGVKRLRGPRVPLAAVIESAYAQFRLEYKGRLPTMGFSGDTLIELTGVAVTQRRRFLGLHRADVDQITQARGTDLPVTVSTVGVSPLMYTDVVDYRKRTFDAQCQALVPGRGENTLLIRGAHVYVVDKVDDRVHLINPWEFSKTADGHTLRAIGDHGGAFSVSHQDFRRLFGHFSLVPPRSVALWERRLR